METPRGPWSNSVISLISAFKILLQAWRTNYPDRIGDIPKILQTCKSIFSSDPVAQAFLYLCASNAATSWLLQVHLDMPESTSYWALKRLRALDVVEPVLKLPKRKLKRGPIPKIWGLVGNYTEEDVAKAINLHYRTLSPKYRLAVEVAQAMLDSYIKPRKLSEISYREILLHVKEMRVPFSKPDIANLAAQYLHERGVKVWR